MENAAINKKIDETLECLNGLKRAESNPFLFTRVMEQMKKPAPGIFKPLAIWQMTSCMLLVLGLNIAIGFYAFKNNAGSHAAQESSYFNNHIYTY